MFMMMMMPPFQVSESSSEHHTHYYKSDAAGDELLCYVFEHKTLNMLRYFNQKLVAKNSR